MEPDQLGHFSLLEKIGEGGMGRVYKARDKNLGRLVALKLLPESRRRDPARRSRFVQEAKAASALNHPNIITIYEIGEELGQIFIAMELVDGKPLNELIPDTGMRLAEAMHVAVQVADALTAAHAVGIVHRDLKPANIMVDGQGRAKVLDFGLAKLSSSESVMSQAEHDLTSTLLDGPMSEPGMIVGSASYMSPEQAEGKSVDSRSDIFSFGSVLYEMVTGKRAFIGESLISTLAAVVQKDPVPPRQLSPRVPPEIERLIARCLRKEVSRRTQHMAGVHKTLEELRDDLGPSKIRSKANPNTFLQALIWKVLVALITVSAIVGGLRVISNSSDSAYKIPEMTRLSPEDDYNYEEPAISPDGGLVTFVSDRSGRDELWLQQVGGGNPIQLTHSNEWVSEPTFSPDGKKIVYIATSEDTTSSAIKSISALGGESQELVRGGAFMNTARVLSPDGNRVAYFESVSGKTRLMTMLLSGHQPKELSNWARMPSAVFGRAAWTSDSKYLICQMLAKSPQINIQQSEWFAFPIGGGIPNRMGAADATHTAGLRLIDAPLLTVGDRAYFYSSKAEGLSTWEIRLSPNPWRVRGVPRQVTPGTLIESSLSISSTGVIALQLSRAQNDLYWVPLNSTVKKTVGETRRLTHDGRVKSLDSIGGPPGYAYFITIRRENGISSRSEYSVEIESSRQNLVMANIPLDATRRCISPDGLKFAYSVPDGEGYSIHVGKSGSDAEDTRVICRLCGIPYRFSPDGQFLFYDPVTKTNDNPNRKMSIRILDVISGESRLWLEVSKESATVSDSIGGEPGWIAVTLQIPEVPESRRVYLVPWHPEPIAQAKWVALPPLSNPNIGAWRAAPSTNMFYRFEGTKVIAIVFDVKKAKFGEPYQLEMPSGSKTNIHPYDRWSVRGPGLVFSRSESVSPSVWLMRLPNR